MMIKHSASAHVITALDWFSFTKAGFSFLHVDMLLFFK